MKRGSSLNGEQAKLFEKEKKKLFLKIFTSGTADCHLCQILNLKMHASAFKRTRMRYIDKINTYLPTLNCKEKFLSSIKIQKHSCEEKERQRERENGRNKARDRQRERERERKRQWQRERERERERDKERETKRETETKREWDRQTDRQTDRQIERERKKDIYRERRYPYCEYD